MLDNDNLSGIKCKVKILTTLAIQRIIKASVLNENSPVSSFFGQGYDEEKETILETGLLTIKPVGDSLQYEVRGTIAKLNQSHIRLSNRKQGIVAQVETFNNEVYYIGTKKNPATIMQDGSTGADFNQLSRMNYVISWTETRD